MGTGFIFFSFSVPPEILYAAIIPLLDQPF